jgi:hypothetical protein
MVVEATVNCSDGLVRLFKDNVMLTQYENPRRASITGLQISGRCHEPYMSAKIELGHKFTFSEEVAVSIWGQEDFVSSMRMTINDILNGTKPWYSSIATISLSLVLYPLFWALVVLGLIMGKPNITI